MRALLFGIALSPALSLASPPPASAPSGLDPSRGIAPLVEAVSPAVLEIEVQGKTTALAEFEGPPGMEEFFRRFMGDLDGERTVRGEGSGFVVDPTGLVLTNHHVVDGASSISARTSTGAVVKARLVASDPATDIALLQLEEAGPWTWLALGDSAQLRVGDPVVAVGNPLGLGLTVTTGIISGKGRNLGDSPYHEFLQTDAAINQGNSGGPLLSLDGKVVGMNTAILQYANAVGFAVPSNQLKRIVEDLRTTGEVRRGYLGVGFQDADADLAAALRLPGGGAAVVTEVSPGSPANKAGIVPGDAITRVGDEGVQNGSGLMRAVARRRPGETVQIEVWTNGKRRTVSVTLTTRPAGPTSAMPAAPREPAGDGTLGVLVKPSPGGGVLIDDVRPEGPAAGKVSRGDLIVKANGVAVNSAEDLRRAVAGTSGRVVLEVKRGDERRFVAVELPKVAP